MRKLLIAAIAALALTLAGASGAEEELKTKRGWPACLADGGTNTFAGFMQAIARQDAFAIEFYVTMKGCGPMQGDMRAEILERTTLGSNQVPLLRVRIHPEGHPPAVIYTIPEALY